MQEAQTSPKQNSEKSAVGCRENSIRITCSEKTPSKRSAQIYLKEQKTSEVSVRNSESPSEPSNKRKKPESSSSKPDSEEHLDPEDSDAKVPVKEQPLPSKTDSPSVGKAELHASSARNLNSPMFLPEVPHLSVEVSQTCRIGPIFDENRIRSLRPYESLLYPDLYTRIVQDLIRCAHHPREVFNAIRVATAGEPYRTIFGVDEDNRKLEPKNIPVMESVNSVQAWFSNLLESLGCCKKLFLPDFLANEFMCKTCFEWNQEQKRSVGDGSGSFVKCHAVTMNTDNSTRDDEGVKKEDAEKERQEDEYRETIKEAPRKIGEEQRKDDEEVIKNSVAPSIPKTVSAPDDAASDVIKPEIKDDATDRFSQSTPSNVADLEEFKDESCDKSPVEEQLVDTTGADHLSMIPIATPPSEEPNSSDIVQSGSGDVATHKCLRPAASEAPLERLLREELDSLNTLREAQEDERRKIEKELGMSVDECYNTLNTFFVNFFRKPQGIGDAAAASSSGVTDPRYEHVRSTIHIDCLGIGWKLGDEELMDSAELRKIPIHSCSKICSPLEVDGTMLEMWKNLLLHCPGCISLSSWPIALDKMKRFVKEEHKKYMERKTALDEEEATTDRCSVAAPGEITILENEDIKEEPIDEPPQENAAVIQMDTSTIRDFEEEKHEVEEMKEVKEEENPREAGEQKKLEDDEVAGSPFPLSQLYPRAQSPGGM